MIDSNAFFSRYSPSARYTELLEEYKGMHKSAKGMFNGRSLVKYVDIIKNYLEKNECKTLIDYGCGKGLLYTDDYELVTEKKPFCLSIGTSLNILCLIQHMKNIVNYQWDYMMQLYVLMY